jgi:hypothetical protein
LKIPSLPKNDFASVLKSSFIYIILQIQKAALAGFYYRWKIFSPIIEDPI